jgi:hypothetical protein
MTTQSGTARACLMELDTLDVDLVPSAGGRRYFRDGELDLFVAEGFDGIEIGGARGGNYSAEDSDE